jgi:DNA-binding transcriptional regulator YiaG
MTQSVDPVGRTFSYLYAANNIDLLEKRQTQDTNNDLLGKWQYNNNQHLPNKYIDGSGQLPDTGKCPTVWTNVQNCAIIAHIDNLRHQRMPDTALNLNDLATAPFAVQVSTLRQLFGFKKAEFAEVLGVNEKTIRRWEDPKETFEPHGSHKQLVDALQIIAESLGDLFEPDMIKVWVDRENPALQGERPRDFVKKPGGILIMAHLLGNLGK